MISRLILLTLLTLENTSRYLDDILKINNTHFDNTVSQIYGNPSELQLNKANTSDTEASYLCLHLSIFNDVVSTKIYDKRDDFYLEIVNFPFLDGDVLRYTSYEVYISQRILLTRASSYVTDKWLLQLLLIVCMLVCLCKLLCLFFWLPYVA